MSSAIKPYQLVVWGSNNSEDNVSHRGWEGQGKDNEEFLGC